MNDGFEVLNENNKDDVLNLFDKKDMAQCHSYPMFKIYDFFQSLQKVFADYAIGGSRKFLNEGVPCELLKLGASKWRKGRLKIKLVLEFYPDEPESPLDDIRQMIKDKPQQDSV